MRKMKYFGAIDDDLVVKIDTRDFSIRFEYNMIWSQLYEHEYEEYINVESYKIIKFFKEIDID